MDRWPKQDPRRTRRGILTRWKGTDHGAWGMQATARPACGRGALNSPAGSYSMLEMDWRCPLESFAVFSTAQFEKDPP